MEVNTTSASSERRHAPSLWIAPAILLLSASALAQAPLPSTVSGTVYLDANANGVRESGETGLPGVRITDGVGFAATGPDGSYSLAVSPDRELPVPGTQPIAVCWPQGTWPTSKRWLLIKEITNPAQADFGLRADPGQKLPFTYLHVTDSHDWRASVYSNQYLTFNTDLKEAKFVVHTGDMGSGGTDPADLLRRGGLLNEWAGLNSMPTFTAVGNHDTDCGTIPEGSEVHYKGGFTACIGPLRWSFNYAGIHFAFVDIIDSNKELSDWAMAWLEKDFASLKPGSRIILSYHYPNLDGDESWAQFLRKHKVEMVHAGHNHSYVRWPDWGAPMVTAFARSAGNAIVSVVDGTGVHIALYCSGCSRGTRDFRHSRRCPTTFDAGALEGAIRGLYGRVHAQTNVSLSGAGAPVAVSTDAVYVKASIDPGTSQAVGLRFGEDSAPHEVSYGDSHLVVDGVAFPVPIPLQEKLVRLVVFAHKDIVTVWANGCFLYENRTQFQRAVNVTPFAAGGAATLASFVVHEVKPDPANRSGGYASSDGNSGLMRNPE